MAIGMTHERQSQLVHSQTRSGVGRLRYEWIDRATADDLGDDLTVQKSALLTTILAEINALSVDVASGLPGRLVVTVGGYLRGLHQCGSLKVGSDYLRKKGFSPH